MWQELGTCGRGIRMLSPLELGAITTAGLSGVTMAWGNIKGVFARVESLIIVKAELESDMSRDFMDYCWVHFKPSLFGIRKFESDDHFIRPKNRLGRVASERTGKFITFWKNRKPIFVSLSLDTNGNNTGITSISFIRGTFDLEKLLIDAANFHDKHKHEKTGDSCRYYVKRCFGKKMAKDSSDPKGSRRPDVDMAENRAGFRPLFYSKEELGVPTSKRPMDNLAYEEGVQDFYEEVSRWKESKEWFKDKGLPWRLGAGLFGPPGSGKTSLARAIGQSLDMPIHSYDLTTMDNEELVNSWQESLGESPCIVLLEDIDRIFDENRQIKTSKDKSPLTLDCLLNCISGVQPSDGILVLVTANDVSKLDPALGVPDGDGKSTRPGRLDRAVYVGILNMDGRKKIANRILSDSPDLIEGTVLEGEGETGAQFEKRCADLALTKYWGKFKVYGDKTT
jgi:hypothetical protein